jgi:hypothetical protein
MRFLFSIVVACLVLISCAHISKGNSEDRFVGSWYGEISMEYAKLTNKTQKWVATFSADGKWCIHLKMYDDTTKALLEEQTEVGRWWVEDGILVTKISEIITHGITHTPKTPEGFYLEKFSVANFSNNSFTYRDIKEGTQFTVEKVPEGYKF